MGTKFFYDTQKPCTKDDGTECNQHLYFDTVPPPNEELRGTIPGAMYMFRKLDTDDIFSAFSPNSEGTECVEVTLKTRNIDHTLQQLGINQDKIIMFLVYSLLSSVIGILFCYLGMNIVK